MKKTVSIVLLLTLLLPLIVSCGEGTDQTNAPDKPASPAVVSDAADPGEENPAEPETEAAAENPILEDGLGDLDLGGYDFRILSCFYNDLDTWRYLLCDELTGIPLNDQLYETKLYLEDRFNIHFSMIEPGNDEVAMNAFMASVTSGDDAFDMHVGKNWRTCQLGTKGYCYNMYEIDEFDFEKPWWPKETVNQLTIGKKMFAASNYASYCGIHWTRVMVANKDLLAARQMEVPYETVREGKWTLDELYTMTNGMSEDTNGDGTIGEGDVVALLGYDQAYYCLQESADCSVYRRDEEHIPYLDLDVDRISGYVDKMRKLMTGSDYRQGSTAEFANNTAVFAFCEIRDAYNIYRGSDVRYGFLPPPKYDEAQDRYISCCTDTVWALPRTLPASRESSTGTILEALSCHNYNYMLPVYLESTLKSRLADNPDDAEMLQIIVDSRTIAFAFAMKLTYDNFIKDVVFNNQEVASYLQKSAKLAQKTLEGVVEGYIGD
ncbi:MAG: hypothetical protein II779_08960 [Clostridia bacterium]|nr:hypothetical protein [Clostridia bacterium]